MAKNQLRVVFGFVLVAAMAVSAFAARGLGGAASTGVALPEAAAHAAAQRSAPKAASHALQPGAQAPAFRAEASLAGKDFTFSLRQALAKGPVVVYFFPSAFTQGCDMEAHAFATEIAKFQAAGATVIGVSADSLQRLNAFSTDPKYCAKAFPVASDASLKIAKEYGLRASAGRPGMKDVRGVEIGHPFIERTTFVINPAGRIVATFSSAADHISPAQHVARSLAVVQKLQAR